MHQRRELRDNKADDYKSMNIRDAKESDLSQLQDLHTKLQLDLSKLGETTYDTEVQKKGFMLGTDGVHDMAEELSKAYKFLVAEDNGIILGFLIADHRKEQKFYDDEYKTWFDTKLKDFYYASEKGMTVATILVDPESTKKGVAGALLEELEKDLKSNSFEYLFSIVVVAPVTNTPSIIWHTKQGFKRLAMGRPRRLFELDNFVSVLLYKKIS